MSTHRILKANRKPLTLAQWCSLGLASVAGFVVLLADGVRLSTEKKKSPASVEQMRVALEYHEGEADRLRHQLKRMK